MTSSRLETKGSTDIRLEEQLIWRDWKPIHPELKRTERMLTPDSRIAIGRYMQAPNIVIMDPKNQSIKILPPTGDDVMLGKRLSMLLERLKACCLRRHSL